MIVCSSWRMLSSWSFVVWVASNKNVSNAIQPPYLLLAGWSASWHINPLSNALSVVLDTAIECTVVDHNRIYMIPTFWKHIPPLRLEGMIFVLWDASIHAEKSLIWDRSIVWIDCLHCVHCLSVVVVVVGAGDCSPCCWLYSFTDLIKLLQW